MNILHYAPNLGAGGTRAFAADLACELEAREEVHNAVMGPAGKLDSRLNTAGVRHLVSHTGLFQVVQDGMMLKRFLHRRSVDVILAYTAGAAWVAGRLCRKLPEKKRPRLVGVISTYPGKSLLGSGWAYCDAITVVSRQLRQELETAVPWLNKKITWVVPYGMREKWCNPAYQPVEGWTEAWERQFPRKGKELRLCLPAPISPLHGFDELATLLSALQRGGVAAKVFVVGNMAKADPQYLAQLREQLNKAQMADSVVWLGARPDLRDVLCACDITLSLGTQAASYNRPVLEALSLGRPVVGYDSGVVGELLTAFMPEGRVAPGQVEAMADTITQWSFYSPTAPESIPYPYRLADTAELYMQLLKSLQHKP